MILKIIKSLKEIIITYILQYLLIIISTFIYVKITNKDINTFINNYSIYIIIPFTILITIYLYNKYKRKENNIPKKIIIIYLSLGISLSCLLNMIIFKIITPTPSTYNISPILLFISTGITGPIYEEILFRYIFLSKLNKITTPKKAIIINTIIFSLIHINPIKIIYAFILGLILSITYTKYKNIIIPILIHIGANSIAILLQQFNIYILVLSIILFIISISIIETKRKI